MKESTSIFLLLILSIICFEINKYYVVKDFRQKINILEEKNYQLIDRIEKLNQDIKITDSCYKKLENDYLNIIMTPDDWKPVN